MSATTTGWTFRLTAPDGRFVDFSNWSVEHVEGTPGEVELSWADNVYELQLEPAAVATPATEVGPTTYTTRAGNLWVWTLGASADVWVRQIDRARHLFAGELDTDDLEAWDAGPNAVDPWFRLGDALGLKGVLLLRREGNGLHTLHENGEPVHVFANGTIETDLPVTVVPLLLETDNEPGLTAILEAILSVVEAKPDTPTGPPWLPGAPIDRTLEYEVRRIDGYGGLFYIRADAIGWSSFSATSSDTFSPNGWSSWECRPLPAGCSWWSVDRSWVYAPEHPNAAAYTTRTALAKAHPAIARIDALIALNLSGLEPRSKTDPRTYSPKHSERVDIALEVERLTAARLNLMKAGPS